MHGLLSVCCVADRELRHCSQEFLQRLKTVLRQFPPPQPTKPAVDLLVSVGDQQNYLSANNLLPPPGSEGTLDALQACAHLLHGLRVAWSNKHNHVPSGHGHVFKPN